MHINRNDQNTANFSVNEEMLRKNHAAKRDEELAKIVASNIAKENSTKPTKLEIAFATIAITIGIFVFVMVSSAHPWAAIAVIAASAITNVVWQCVLNIKRK